MRRQVPIDPSCRRCWFHIENMDHILLHCPYAWAMWFGLGLTLRISFGVSSFSQWLQSWDHLFASSKGTARKVWSQISFLCWFTSLSRNELYFHAMQWTPSEIIEKPSKVFKEFINVFPLSKETQFIRSSHSWSPLKPGYTKLNSDVAFHGEHHSGCIGFILGILMAIPSLQHHKIFQFLLSLWKRLWRFGQVFLQLLLMDSQI
ncbi:hypothetical protein NE237_010933 [Protea cynaroides]|uniref:Reverse transcriptase zinc-binding domain-containing protein n=1 Tax=Protea cynaroides TaxID=273540 RepID=A0A9Q0L093_9MAGN|nr:hypothetical protein NE237_010933 [Protea cynaroides]